MRRHHLIVMTLVFAALRAACGGAACSGGGAQASQRERTLLVCVAFYHSHNVGAVSPPTGLLRQGEQASEFRPLCWPELITSSVSVDAEGRWIYLACGNGVMVSRDAGQTWFLTGGWEIAEVQGVAIDRRDARRAWAATAYGLYASSDILGRDPWHKISADGLFRFCSDVEQDLLSPDVLWVASDEGVFVSRDAGRTLRRSGARVAVRRILQDESAPERLLVATDGDGLLETRDAGATWRRLETSPDVVFCVELHPDEPERLACGAMDGVHVSADGGLTWCHSADGLPGDFFVMAVRFDPEDAAHLCVAGTDGLFESRDEGRSWQRLGLEGVFVRDLCFASLATTAAVPPPAEKGRLDLEGLERDFEENRPTGDAAFEERRARLVEQLRSDLPSDGASRIDWLRAILAARDEGLRSSLWRVLEEQLARPGTAMFFSMPAIGFFLHARETLPAPLAERFRMVLTGCPIYRGDTENHWVMYYSALLLAAQTWPETSAAAWYTGRDTQSNYAEAKGWLQHWASLTASKGQGEFDSPHYFLTYVTPMLLLYDFAREPELRQLAGMMLDLLLADYLVESLRGAYCGGHSRAPEPTVFESANNAASAYHYLYAGGIEMPSVLHPWVAAAALSSYRPPAVFSAIANERSRPFVHTEVKRVRNVIRYGREVNPPVQKVDFMTARYCLGSLQGGILQPIQQHTWDVTWIGSAPNSVLFTVHPFVSGFELGMFFPEEPRYLTRSVGFQKSSYVSPDKWVSSSPYEKIFQHENVLLALYQVPREENFQHVSLYWPRCLERSEAEGWLFGRDGDFCVACFACQEGEWSVAGDHERLRCDGVKAGFVVVTPDEGRVAEGARGLEAFKHQILASGRPVLEGRGEGLTVRVRLPDGRLLERRWGDEAGTLDGKPLLFPADQLFAGPFIRAKTGSKVITLTDGRHGRVLDFNDLRIRTREVGD
ncbi:MAG: hypothetical protein AB1486_22155 [Planctomycetota bacterium]